MNQKITNGREITNERIGALAATDAHWTAAQNAEGIEIYVRQDAPAAPKTTKPSYAPLTHRQTAALVIVCVLGVLLTAAVGFRLLVWGLR